MAKKDRDDLKITTPEFRGSFVTLKKPRAFGNSDPKYSITITLPDDDEFWDDLMDKVEAAAEKRWDGKIPKNMHIPIRHGDETEYEDWEGQKFCQAASEDRPGIIDVDGEDIIDFSELYSGAWYRASIRAYAWHYPETNKKGVSLQLDNVMKIRDDEPFSGRSSAADDFAEFVAGGKDKSSSRRKRRERKNRRGSSSSLVD
jgi:hypothetical protein